MFRRLFAPAFAALLLAGCVSDVPDDAAPTTTSTPSNWAERMTEALPTASSVPAVPSTEARAPTATPTPGPTRVPQPVSTPGGTTGLGDDAEVLGRDEGCLDESTEGTETETLPSASPAFTPTASAPTQYPGAYTPIDFQEDAALKQLLEGAMGDRAGDYAFYVKDLTTGKGATHNGGEVFNAASLFKLFVMYSIFHQESLGLINWNDKLVVTPYYDAFALSPRVTELCQVLTVAEAMDAMLSVSDNAAAVLLQDLAQSSNVNTAIQSLGLTQSGLFVEGLPVTADDLALLMEAIAVGATISPEASADMIALLDHDVFENGLVSGVPAGTQVARKTGNWSDATNVAGIVLAPWGPYVFVALTSNGYETDVIQALSSATYTYFEALNGQAQR